MTEQKQSLADIVGQANAIEMKLMESGGELTPELEAALLQVDASLPEKLDGYDVVMARLAAAEKMWAARADEYARVASALSNAQSRMKERLKWAMGQMGKSEVSGNEVRFTLVNGKPKLVINGEVPEAYVTIVQTKQADKERIRADLEMGVKIPGASLEPTVQLRRYAARKEA